MKVSVRAAVFGDDRVDVAVLDHHRIVEHRHVGHAAVGMALVEIGAEQRILLGRRLGRNDRADQFGVGAQDAALARPG